MERRRLIVTTVASLEGEVKSLEEEQRKIAARIVEKTEALQAWRRELAQIDKGKTPGQRIPKGDARRLINEWYDKNPASQESGMTIKEIATNTGLKWSTVRNVVTNPKNKFAVTDGRYRRGLEIGQSPRLKAVN